MAPGGVLMKGASFVSRRYHIFRAVFVIACLFAFYLFVVSFLLLSEMGSRFRTWEGMYRILEKEHVIVDSRVDAKGQPTASNGTPPIKTILLWNSFFSSPDYHFGVGREPFLQHACPVNSCSVTLNRTELEFASAVLLHTPQVSVMPSYRTPNQKYVFVQREPHYPKSKQLLDNFYDMFNLTMTYRYDSDIPIPYGMVVNRTPDSEPYSVYPPENKRLVVWVVSHCNSLGRREMYMEELSKYIHVDIYGDCGNLTCNRSDVYGCMHKLERQYRFYVAFENTYCLDYASEKLYRSLLYDMVPIVYGRVNYTAVSPEHSVIDILDFPNPRLLADYLYYLVNTPDEYSRYFRWKESYTIVQSRNEIFAHAFCRLCEILQDENYPYRDYRNISAWWLDGTCELGFMMKFRKTHHW